MHAYMHTSRYGHIHIQKHARTCIHIKIRNQEPSRTSHKALLQIALKSNNISFVGQPRIDLIVESWWQRETGIRVNFWKPHTFFNAPNNKMLLDRFAFLTFLVLYSVVLSQDVKVTDNMSFCEVLFYIVGKCTLEGKGPQHSY